MDDASHAHHAGYLLEILLFLGAAVVAVPLFRFVGLSAVLGYLVAGIVIGPSGLKLFNDPSTLLGIAEIGVVMFLFLIGLELQPSQLLSMRRNIAVLGAGQMVLSAAILGTALKMAGFSTPLAVVAGLALALSATAIALQMLEERGALQTPYGQRTFAVLLFQDMSVVPILAGLPIVASFVFGNGEMGGFTDVLRQVAIAVGMLAGLVLVGRYALNPFFRLLARVGARELMTAAALLVVLGSAFAMQFAGMSMALGAFLAGLLLSESNFRHQLEADIEPFRGLLLGLFFISVGMSIDGQVVLAQAMPLMFGAIAVVTLKLALGYGVMRLGGTQHEDSLRAAALLTPAGEFAFVLLPLAVTYSFARPAEATLISALAALTMLLGPIAAKGIELLLRARVEDTGGTAPELDDFSEARGNVLVIGFGRFGQVVNQVLLAAGTDVTVIDRDIEMIRAAATFGTKVYFGDGTRLDVLRAAGAERAKLIAICVDDPKQVSIIADLVRTTFPLARCHVRAYDRVHALDLMGRDVDYLVRETFESALAMGSATLVALGEEQERAVAVISDVRKRDTARLVLQKAEGMLGGSYLLTSNVPKPTPLTEPKAKSKGLNAETQTVIDRAVGERAP